MGKFNFGEAGTKSNFGEFVPIVIRHRGRTGAQRIEKPILTMSHATIRIGSYLGEQFINKGYGYVRFMFSKNMLGMQFSKEELPDSVKLRKGKQGTALTCSFSSISSYLATVTDAVNFEVFTYQFDVKHDEKDIYYVELDKPWTKRKVSKK